MSEVEGHLCNSNWGQIWGKPQRPDGVQRGVERGCHRLEQRELAEGHQRRFLRSLGQDRSKQLDSGAVVLFRWCGNWVRVTQECLSQPWA